MACLILRPSAGGVLLLSLTALVALPTRPARANVYEVFGAGARAEAMAGAMTATAADYTAVWYNPAGLAHAQDAVGLGLSGAFDRTSILLAPRPRGYDPPDYKLCLNPRKDSSGPGTVFGITLGISLKLFSEDLHAGFLLYLPSAGFAHADPHFVDERQQYFDNRLRFERLDERLKSEVMAGALSYRLADWLSLGLGVNLLQSSNNITQVHTPNAVEPGKSYLSTRLEQQTETALIAGALVQPWPFLRFGLSFRDEINFQIRGRSEIQIRGQEQDDEYPILQPIRQGQHGTVPQASLGVAYLMAPWTATVQSTYEIWSRYRNTAGEPARFDDTYSVAGAFEYELRPGTRFRGGVGWHPSPVPGQVGRTNYVDNDRLVASLGGGKQFTLWDRKFELDFSVQLQTLLARETTKVLPARPTACEPNARWLCDEVVDSAVDTPTLSAAETRGLQTGNPGFPGFSSGGYLMAAGADVRWLF